MRTGGVSCCAGAAQGVAEIAELAGGAEVKVADRATAETLTNTRLYVDRAQLPEPDEDEFYLADLIGLQRAMPTGCRSARSARCTTTAPAQAWRSSRRGGRPLLLPFTRACVPQVDVAAGRVVVVPPAAVDIARRRARGGLIRWPGAPPC